MPKTLWLTSVVRMIIKAMTGKLTETYLPKLIFSGILPHVHPLEETLIIIITIPLAILPTKTQKIIKTLIHSRKTLDITAPGHGQIHSPIPILSKSIISKYWSDPKQSRIMAGPSTEQG